MKIEHITTTITMKIDDYEFMFEPEIMYSYVKKDYKTAGNFFEKEEEKSKEYISFNEIINTKLFGDVKFTIWNNKIFTRIENNYYNIFVELENTLLNINADNIKQLKITVDYFEQMKINSVEYLKNNLMNDYRLLEFFIELFLNRMDHNTNNINQVSNKIIEIPDLEKLIELPVDEKIKFIPFYKLIIKHLRNNKYNIVLGFCSKIKNNCTTLWFHYDENYCINYFNIEDGKK
jgi:hypothetical protein